jgi:tetratricopeptide (TPR) repeat protein
LWFVWGGALPKDTVHMTLAAALLAHDPDRDVAAGTACGMTTIEGQHVCDQMVARGLKTRGKWADLEAYAAAWIARAPAEYAIEATRNRATALAQLGRLDEADKLVEDTSAAHPDDLTVLFLRMDVAAYRGQHDELAKRADAAAKGTKDPCDYNTISWLEYVENVDTPGALERAREAFLVAPKDGPLANTLAALEVASGDAKAALDHERAALDLGHKAAPGDADWLVLAHIYEDLGLRDDAIAAYRRIAAPRLPDLLPTPYSLATARLKILGALKK